MNITSTRRALGRIVGMIPGAALTVLLLWPSTAVASESDRRLPAAHVSCGDTIVVDTRLANDLSDCPGNGIIIGADNVTLDLDGHTVDGDGIADASGVLNQGFDQVAVRGGSIQDFAEGVAVLDATGGRIRDLSFSNHSHVAVFVIRSNDVTIERNMVVDTTFAGIFAFESSGVRIERNTSSGNGAGIAVTGSDGVRVTGNVVSGNGFVGIVVESDGSTVDHNQIVDNGNGVIVFANHATITDNDIDGAVGCLSISDEECVPPPPGDCPDCTEGWGISVEGGAGSVVARNDVRRAVRDGIRVATFDPDTATVDTVVRDNHVRDTVLDGFAIGIDGEEPPRGTQVVGNQATGSGDDGFDVRSPLTTLTRNLAERSDDLGIDAAPGVTDGGGNRARQSGDPAQCVGIRCR